MTKYTLNGCDPKVFGSYLKALGLFEILAKQYNDVKAYWENDSFNILLPLESKEEIINFFMEKYKPLPIVSPWNKGGGFINSKKELTDLLGLKDPRLKTYQNVIRKAQYIMSQLGITGITHKNKVTIVKACRNYLPPDTIKWIDAALVIGNENLFVTKIMTNGGNEGNFDYSNAYMKYIYYIFNNIKKNNNKIEELLKNSIFGTYTDKLIEMKVGKFIPGRAGGFNEGFGFENKEFNANPWDYIFLIHGLLFFSTGLGKRTMSNKYFIRSPFTVESSVSIDTENKNSVYEIWAPLWKNPAYLSEIKKMFENGRVEISNSPVTKGIEFMEAIKNYGVDRGIEQFVRYVLLNTRGRSGYVAAPAGAYQTGYMPDINIVKEINPLLNRLDSYIYRLERPPKSLLVLKLNIDNALSNMLTHGISVGIEKLLVSIGKMEMYLSKIQHNDILANPPVIDGLSPDWLNLNKEPSNEYIIASAISSIYGIRNYLEPLMKMKWNDSVNDYSWNGSNIYARISNVVYRMFIKNMDKYSPLSSRLIINPEYATLVIDGDLGGDKLENLLYGLMWIKWNKNKQEDDTKTRKKYDVEKSKIDKPLYLEYATIKLLYVGNKININEEDIEVKGNAKLIGMLKGNNIKDAYGVAYNTIRSKNIDIIHQDLFNELEGTRLAASLLIPAKYKSLESLIMKNIKESA